MVAIITVVIFIAVYFFGTSTALLVVAVASCFVPDEIPAVDEVIEVALVIKKTGILDKIFSGISNKFNLNKYTDKIDTQKVEEGSGKALDFASLSDEEKKAAVKEKVAEKVNKKIADRYENSSRMTQFDNLK